MNTENILEKINIDLDKKTISKIEEIKQKRQNYGYIDFDSYKINEIKKKLFETLKSFDDIIINQDDIQLTFVDRNKFDADLCIKLPALLQKYKKDYVREVVPKLINFLNNSDLVENNIISKIESIGIYLNVSLDDNFLFSSLLDIFEKADKFGENDLKKEKSIVVDYSSPNVAKHLHAGHIRSTIIGHVLSNLYEKNGYYTHRVNHINDWGGFGFLIEGYNRWLNILEEFENKNDLLFFIYTIYRKGEKASVEENFIKTDDISLDELRKYYGEFSDYNGFKKLFDDFVKSGRERFTELEKGDFKVVRLWEEMVKWSLADFEKFYNLLGIHQDYVIGESFYSNYGFELIMQFEKEGKVVLYTRDLADIDIKSLQEKLDNEEITEKSFDAISEEIIRDIGAYVVILDDFERFVVLKSDKSSIYATRDLAAIKYRHKTFSPSSIVYEVGQEQAEHFDKLFKSAKKIGIEDITFEHIYHGFYVDSKSKKKLSSRDGASNVGRLITESIEFFKSKYSNSEEFTKEQIDDIAYKMAIGSIIFNDIKSDKKNPVAISSDILESCQAFEESGGAYVMYSVVRANSILAKINGAENITVENTKLESLDNIEKIILNELLKYPLIVKQASENNNPATLVGFILDLARYYNSYYNSHRVMDDGKIIESRVLITKSVSLVLKNAMRICHIEIPNRI